MSTRSLPTPVPLERAARRSLRALRGLAFWSAVVLPFLYLPLLLAWPWSDDVALAFAALVAVNVAAALAGHGHNAGQDGTSA